MNCNLIDNSLQYVLYAQLVLIVGLGLGMIAQSSASKQIGKPQVVTHVESSMQTDSLMLGANDPIIAEFMLLSRKYNALFESQCSAKQFRDAETQVTPIAFIITDFTFNKDQNIKNSEPIVQVPDQDILKAV